MGKLFYDASQSERQNRMVVLKSRIENTKGEVHLRESTTNLSYKKQTNICGQQVVGNLASLTREISSVTGFESHQDTLSFKTK